MLQHPVDWIAAGLFFVVSAFLIVICSSITIRMHWQRQGTNDHLEFSLFAFRGLLRYHYEVPVMDLQGLKAKVRAEKSGTSFAGIGTGEAEDVADIDPHTVQRLSERVRFAYARYDELSAWLRKALARIRITDWRWDSAVGAGDAMWTALAAGSYWALKGMLLGYVSKRMQLECEPAMSVEPDFEQARYDTRLECIARMRIGYAILAALHLAIRFRIRRRAGAPSWRRILARQ